MISKVQIKLLLSLSVCISGLHYVLGMEASQFNNKSCKFIEINLPLSWSRMNGQIAATAMYSSSEKQESEENKTLKTLKNYENYSQVRAFFGQFIQLQTLYHLYI